MPSVSAVRPSTAAILIRRGSPLPRYLFTETSAWSSPSGAEPQKTFRSPDLDLQFFNTIGNQGEAWRPPPPIFSLCSYLSALSSQLYACRISDGNSRKRVFMRVGADRWRARWMTDACRMDGRKRPTAASVWASRAVRPSSTPNRGFRPFAACGANEINNLAAQF